MQSVTDDRVLRFDYRGAPQTVGVLRRAALDSQNHMAVRQLAEMFCSQVDSKDYVSEYLACHYGLLNRCRYMRDPRTVELVRAPYLIAQEILAGGRPSLDCDDFTAIEAALVLAVGGSTRITTVAFRRMLYEGRVQYSHVFAEAQVPQTGRWLVLDPVAEPDVAGMLRRVVEAKIWPVA